MKLIASLIAIAAVLVVAGQRRASRMSQLTISAGGYTRNSYSETRECRRLGGTGPAMPPS
jgi:hypothetical protein